MKRHGSSLLLGGFFLALAGCGGDTVHHDETLALHSLDEVGEAEWESLGDRRIFFGHQSVGRNIVAGIEEVLAENPQIRINLVRDPDPNGVEGPAFVESDIGKNGDPASKSDAFAAVIDAGFGDAPGAIAMYKFCYVDILPGTDIDALFEDYVRRTEELKARFPELTIVHFTLPLHTARTGAKELLKTFLGRKTQIGLNLMRNRYNERLVERYGETDPVFDLARLESTRPDGSRAYVLYGTRKVYMMAEEWTDDGGHLNEAARRRVAEQLLAFLAKLGPTQGIKSQAVAADTSDVDEPATD